MRGGHGPSVWLIAGPTASGKSALALRLAEETGGEVVNADSMQVYADLSVLTARPTTKEMSRAPHHLYGVADGAEAWSAGRWLRAAQAVLADIAARGRTAVVVGGTGLYLGALTKGLSDIPAIPEAVRAQAQALFDAQGEATFRARLADLDREAEARISPADRQRLTRAYEVAAATGRSLTDWRKTAIPPLSQGFRAVVLEPPRADLYARCDTRVPAMIEHGALEEVRALIDRNLDLALPVMKALGAREFTAHLRGETTLVEAVALTQQSTRNYAKRQTTWFRGQAADWPRIAAVDHAEQWAALQALAKSFALGLTGEHTREQTT